MRHFALFVIEDYMSPRICSDSREKHPNFKKKVLKRDGYHCIYCHLDKFLHATHIISLHDGLAKGYTLEQLYDTDNGVTLCKDCHYLYDWAVNSSPHKYSRSYLPGRKKYRARFIKKAVEHYMEAKQWLKKSIM